MKRWASATAFVLFLALCASVAYWGAELLKPASRTVAAPASARAQAPKAEAAAGLFGGRPTAVAQASNYQLRGVIGAGKLSESVVILSADGKPAQAYRAGKEIAPGVKIKEVHPRYVVIEEGGVAKRVELPDEKSQVAQNNSAPVRATTPPPRQMPPPVQAQSNPTDMATSGASSAAVQGGAMVVQPGQVAPSPAQQPTVITGPGSPAPVSAASPAAPAAPISSVTPLPGAVAPAATPPSAAGVSTGAAIQTTPQAPTQQQAIPGVPRQVPAQ